MSIGEKTPNEPNNQISLTSVSGLTPGHSVLPMEENPLTSMEGVFGHSVPLTEKDPLVSTEGVFSHLVPSMEDSSQVNCVSKMTETPDSSNNPSLSIADLPLTQEKVETTYADVFQGLGKFPGEPYKLRLKPNAVPAKHRPRKVPVHLQDAFHEEVEPLVKIDVLEKVTEPTEWVNSFVIVEKVIDSSNAHSPNHVIKKSIDCAQILMI